MLEPLDSLCGKKVVRRLFVGKSVGQVANVVFDIGSCGLETSGYEAFSGLKS